MPEKKDPAGIIPDWFNRDMDFDGDCDLLDMMLYEDQFREEEEETPSYLEDEEDELEDDDALMERLSEMDETEREFFLMDHPTIQQRIEGDFELEKFMSELDTERESEDFSDEDDDFYDEDEEFDDEDDDASDEFEDDEELDAFEYDEGVLSRRRGARENLEFSDDTGNERCKFILSNSCIPSRYLTTWGDYLYASALKNQFELPINIPDEIDDVEMRLYDLIDHLIAIDVHLAIACWAWCLEVFTPYLMYASEPEELTVPLFLLCENYFAELIDYEKQHPDFLKKAILYSPELQLGLHYLIVGALEKCEIDIARRIIEYVFANKHATVNDKIDLMDYSLFLCTQYDDIAVMQRFHKYIFSIVDSETDLRFVNQKSRWKKEIEEFYAEIAGAHEEEDGTDWRRKYLRVPNTIGVDPCDYESEDEYWAAMRRYQWREGKENPFGISPLDFETRTEYEAALSEAYRKEREEREEKRRKMMHVEDTTLYKFCKISTNYPLKPHYYYLTGDLNVKVGDLVAVPLGYKNAETLGVVVSVGQCYSFSFPCALDQMKTVIRIEETSPHGADESVEKKQHANNAAEAKSSPLEKVDPAICLRKIYDIVDRAGKRAKADFRSIAGLWVGALIKYAIDRTSILRRKKLEVFDSCMAALEYDGVVNGMAVYSEHPPEEIQVIVGSLDNIAVGFPKIIFAYSDNDDKRLFTTRVVSLLQWLEAYVVKNFNATESNLASSHYLQEMKDLEEF